MLPTDFWEFRVCLIYDRAREVPVDMPFRRFEAAQAAVAGIVRGGRAKGRIRRALVQRRPRMATRSSFSPISADPQGMKGQEAADRWETVQAWETEVIERILDQTAQEAGVSRRPVVPDSPGLRIRWSQYRRCRYLMGGTTLLLLTMLGSFASWQAHAAPISSLQSILPKPNTTDELPFSPADLKRTAPGHGPVAHGR